MKMMSTSIFFLISETPTEIAKARMADMVSKGMAYSAAHVTRVSPCLR